MTTTSLKDSVNRFFRESVPLEWYLPIVLPNCSQVTELTCKCQACGKIVASDDLRGSIHRSIRGFRMTAFGFCEDCNLLTPYLYDIVPQENGFTLLHEKWKGWREGEVVHVDFRKKKPVLPD